jgi:hypothetical protein
MMRLEQLQDAGIPELERLARYVGVEAPARVSSPRQYRHALACVILRGIKRGGRRVPATLPESRAARAQREA